MFRSLLRPIQMMSVAAIPVLAILPAQTLADSGKAACMLADVDARIVHAQSADYPELAQKEGITGTAFVKVDLMPTGTIADVSIAQSSGNPLLDGAALDAVRESRFAPARHDCKQIAGTYLVQVDWN
jgi:protein TonB